MEKIHKEGHDHNVGHISVHIAAPSRPFPASPARSGGISLCYAAADDGDWAGVLPETVKLLQEHLGTQQFAVLTGEEQPERWLREVVD